MLKNYFMTTLRTVTKYKGFLVINVLGLALSTAVCLVIILFIRSEKSYDQFHENKDRIYRVNSTVTYESSIDHLAASPAPLAGMLRQDYPFVEEAVSLRQLNTTAVYQDKRLAIRGIFAEPSLFSVFSFELTAGNPQKALNEPLTIVLSEETAKRFFGDLDPIGKSLLLDGIVPVAVTGVFKKPAGKSHLDRNFEAVASFSTLKASNKPEFYLNDWKKGVGQYYTYVLLQSGISSDELEKALSEIVQKYYPDVETETYAFFLQALTNIRFGPDLSNKIERQIPAVLISILAVLALILVLTASFNYMNLSVARSLKRAKEIGIRKVSGAYRGQIIFQFLAEGVLVSWLALGIALLFLETWLIPAFNSLHITKNYLEASISSQFWSEPVSYVIFISFSTLVGLLAGLYPAIVLSSYRPSVVLKGTSSIKGFLGAKLRKSLIIAQFALSIIFIITTLVVNKQSQYMLAADYGFDKEHVVNLALQGTSYSTLRAELLTDSRIEGVSAVSIIPGTGDREMERFLTRNLEKPLWIGRLAIDDNFIENLDIPVIAGRSFSRGFVAKSSEIILNESAVEALALGTPNEAIGQSATIRENQAVSIIGVIKDFYLMKLGRTEPLALFYDESNVNFANIRIAGGDIPGALAFIEEAWKKVDSKQPVRYRFFDEQLAAVFVEFKDYIGLIGLGSGFIIFIACLGLLGIATFNAETRVKEVGVRKVLGASVQNILVLLSKDFFKLILISAVIASPIAWYLNDQMLRNFSYRIEVGFGVAIIGIAITFVLAITVIAFQAIKAAFANPVDSLRYE